MKETGTATAILDIAQELTQKRGYNAFSFRDLANEVGIKTSSIHYYFPTKGNLGQALVVRYRQSFQELLADIDAATTDPKKKLQKFVGLLQETLEGDGRVCLCGMLATDQASLPKEVQKEVKTFFKELEGWLGKVLLEAQRTGVFRKQKDTAVAASSLLAGLEGAMIVSYGLSDCHYFKKTCAWFLRMLEK